MMRNQWGLCFVDKVGSNYKTKAPLISRQLTANKAFNREFSFYSSGRPYLQNEDPIDFASFGVWGKALTRFDCLWYLFWVYGLLRHRPPSWWIFSFTLRKFCHPEPDEIFNFTRPICGFPRATLTYPAYIICIHLKKAKQWPDRKRQPGGKLRKFGLSTELIM